MAKPDQKSHIHHRVLPIVGAVLLLMAPLLCQADVGAALNAARRACNPDVHSMLREQPQLSKAALKYRKGLLPNDAARAVGYESTQLASLHFQGLTGSDLLQAALVEQSCTIVGDADAREFGYSELGNELWILVGTSRGRPAKAAVTARRALELVNQVRARGYVCGSTKYPAVGPLQLNAKLIKAAQSHADEMARLKYVEHEGKDGSTPVSRAAKMGYSWKVVGENVAAGAGSVELAIEDWLGSPHHCANILDPRFTEMGIAFSINSADQDYGVYWTQTFGAPKVKRD